MAAQSIHSPMHIYLSTDNEATWLVIWRESILHTEHLQQLAKQSLSKVMFPIFLIHCWAFSSFQLYYSHLIISDYISDYAIISHKLSYRVITIWAHINITVNENFGVPSSLKKQRKETVFSSSLQVSKRLCCFQPSQYSSVALKCNPVLQNQPTGGWTRSALLRRVLLSHSSACVCLMSLINGFPHGLPTAKMIYMYICIHTHNITSYWTWCQANIGRYSALYKTESFFYTNDTFLLQSKRICILKVASTILVFSWEY